ncbi:MAG: hypothetical protein GEU95_25255 [Rhizobiales bacterium]|nr:hypothetical protein [Hyphomicrobiales bacterium]
MSEEIVKQIVRAKLFEDLKSPSQDEQHPSSERTNRRKLAGRESQARQRVVCPPLTVFPPMIVGPLPAIRMASGYARLIGVVAVSTWTSDAGK